MTEETVVKSSAAILVVEDDKFYANIYRTKFAKEGYEIRLAGDGDEALKMAREQKPDLILLDLIMPKKDGFETLRELKSDSDLRDVKVVVFSNLSQDEDVKRVMDLGAHDYIVKANISLQDMIERVKKYLSE